MSNAQRNLYTFIVYAPDKTDDGALQRRLNVRPTHMARGSDLSKNGTLKLGGAMLTPECITTPDAKKEMIGSVLLFEAETIEDVKKIVETDIYYTSGVWDTEKIVIKPFAIGIGSLA
ncbi:hypothetical protein BD410DRAFT_725993 [Rickenella mellea]|uniref:YCII-related domain-containing protein n=1 Tax=Rickenella mellea TaxID=50990 RepID=A0A4Y7Q0K8_9AGAM|nr:hypothetical protein BD410DRAFT_725993 [Rickenella mellea]